MKNSVEIAKYVESTSFNDLGRGSKTEYFINLLLDFKLNHICLNGEWGSGKTTFIHNVIKRIKNKVDNYNTIICFNAWKHENYEDPMLAIISCINKMQPNLINDIF